MAEKLLPGVIICDWNLPGTTNALAICQTIKRHPLLSITSLLGRQRRRWAAPALLPGCTHLSPTAGPSPAHPGCL